MTNAVMKVPKAHALVAKLESEEEFEKIAKELVEELVRADRYWAYADPGEVFEIIGGYLSSRTSKV